MPPESGRKGKQLGLYVSDEAAAKLRTLSEKTDIPQSRLLRQAMQLLFEKYANVLAEKPGKSRK